MFLKLNFLHTLHNAMFANSALNGPSIGKTLNRWKKLSLNLKQFVCLLAIVIKFNIVFISQFLFEFSKFNIVFISIPADDCFVMYQTFYFQHLLVRLSLLYLNETPFFLFGFSLFWVYFRFFKNHSILLLFKKSYS